MMTVEEFSKELSLLTAKIVHSVGQDPNTMDRAKLASVMMAKAAMITSFIGGPSIDEERLNLLLDANVEFYRAEALRIHRGAIAFMEEIRANPDMPELRRH